ncbi:hypothetical protein N7466_006555 [Penicillium verhagenii]|uniref:uncharacterized protein n=1 Tax=Penicillium verhagenii TaxID=1562060 RepID=UPI002545767B|nr:uncharacterized protein N7466_006555 [Penicillium verhagenii]KAJ5931062.1 hypothetical protein N7466_006555 [Penicillium verhagenii]
MEILDKEANPKDAFKCQFSGCNASYRRKEHLNRHETKHTQQKSFPCSNCDRTFGRSDTLRRHLQRNHQITEPLKRASRACENCHAAKARCQGGVPCDECVRRKFKCSFDKDNRSEERGHSESSTGPPSSPRNEHPPLDHSDKQAEYIRLYFQLFHPHWSFVHKGSFDMKHETPLLVQSMVVLGMWASGEQSAQLAAVELHNTLRLAVRDQTEKWDASEADRATSACTWPLPTYQAILLHIIFSFIGRAPGSLNLDLGISLPAEDLGLLQALVRSCRRLGMFNYLNILARFRDSNVPSFIWVSIEEIKRFNLALYKVCGKVSSFSITDGRVADNAGQRDLLAASELQFPMPSNCALWNSAGKDEWMIHIKDTKPVSLDDDCQADWISNFAMTLELLNI